jgi:hypothetical protein
MAVQVGPKGDFPNRKKTLSLALALGVVLSLIVGLFGGMLAPAPAAASSGSGPQVEPGAGTWRTWLLASGSQIRPPAPPARAETKAEIRELKELIKLRDQAALDRIAYWNTAAPVYRWNELAVYEAVQHNMNVFTAGRGLALLHAALYDATIAAWDAKYAYDRPRPSELDHGVRPIIADPGSPSYPSEHAVVAGAASEILAYLFPDRADVYRAKAIQAGEAFMIAGIQYRSDVEVGQELGRQVAQLAIQRAMNDGSNAVWDGSMPSGPGYWTGQNPAGVTVGGWQTWVLESGSEFRPGPPIAYDSPEKAAEMAELRNFQRTPRTNVTALFWEHAAGGARNYWYWNEQLSKKVLEYPLGSNPPRAARAYALESIAFYDTVVACFDAKYTYWAIRPFQLDPTFQPLFTTPNHPSYPAAHACLSNAAAETLAYLFPGDASQFSELAGQAGESRIWGGIHYRSDVLTGQQLGQNVANKVIQLAETDGSQVP